VTRRLTRIAGIALVLAAPIAAQQAPDRSVAPKPQAARAFTPPQVQKRALSNGLPVWIVEQHKVPAVHVTLVARSGSAADPRQKYGLSSLTADMLDEGAGARDALQIADAVDYLGADLSTSSSSDASYVGLHVPAARLTEALGIMADVVRRPTFPEKELARLRQELLTSFIEAEDDPATLIQFAFPRLVYGPSHRYGTLTSGTPASVKQLTVADLRAFHARHYVPANSVIVVAGDVTPADTVARLEKAFGTWKGAAAPGVSVPSSPQLTSRQVFLIDKPGAAQSQIRIGWIGVPRSTPDYFTLQLLNTILGGAFTSRLNTNLREEHGYSYGASSRFDMRRFAGPFYAGAGVQTDKTSESLQEFFKELEGIRKVTPEELEKAKSYVALQLPGAFETTSSTAATLAEMFVHNLPADYYATYTGRIRAVTVADLQRAAERCIQPDKFAVVVIGDRAKIEPKIAALNLGPVKVVPMAEIMK
jgi:zinc protease